ncbi:MAG: alpha/beta hydrolase [Acidimicrobiia bacterium]|nr:alpha/beta hydrolase [Acidimicrobiia bacterium]
MTDALVDSPDRANQPSGPSGRWNRWRRPLTRIGIVVGVLAMIFYAAGGWYFSSLLGEDAFEVSAPDPPVYEVEVDAISTETITLVVPAGSEPDLTGPVVIGFEHENGTLRLGRIIANLTDGTRDIVTRQYDVIRGPKPEVGDLGDLDPWLYTENPWFLLDVPTRVTYESELGPIDALYVSGGTGTWVILVHGKGAAEREAFRMMNAVGPHSMLAISYRNDPGQPADPSGYYRYGATEWKDVEGAVAYALDQGANNVILAGLSTGAALNLSFMYRSDLADHVIGLIFDAPNIDFGRTVDYGASQRDLPLVGLPVPQSLTTVAKFIGALRFGVDWSELDYLDDIDRIDVPILVFHGTNDTTVPVDVSERLAETRPDLVTFLAFEGAEHVQSWNFDPARYDAAMRRFLDALSPSSV